MLPPQDFLRVEPPEPFQMLCQIHLYISDKSVRRLSILLKNPAVRPFSPFGTFFVKNDEVEIRISISTAATHNFFVLLFQHHLLSGSRKYLHRRPVYHAGLQME